MGLRKFSRLLKTKFMEFIVTSSDYMIHLEQMMKSLSAEASISGLYAVSRCRWRCWLWCCSGAGCGRCVSSRATDRDSVVTHFRRAALHLSSTPTYCTQAHGKTYCTSDSFSEQGFDGRSYIYSVGVVLELLFRKVTVLCSWLNSKSTNHFAGLIGNANNHSEDRRWQTKI